MLKITIYQTPPSVNHYTKYRAFQPREGKPIVTAYPGKEAKAWWKAVAFEAGDKVVDAPMYEIAYVVYQGPNERGDVDNYAKCVLDGLVKAGVISSDHLVTAVHGYKKRDRDKPRTEIFIRAAGQLALFEPAMPSIEDW